MGGGSARECGCVAPCVLGSRGGGLLQYASNVHMKRDMEMETDRQRKRQRGERDREGKIKSQFFDI